ncbi:MAG: hypothetical protein PHE83_15955 [Opitutaceae bacterium]|nr:hypothetical protein [Opitutaceae bacterium]
MRTLIRLLLGFSALVLAACSTVDSRIQENPGVFAKLDPATQAKIKQGIIELGFTTDMVYIALGRPDETREHVDAGGRETIWKYTTYYERYEGTVYTGYRRFVYWDKRVKAYRVYHEPVFRDVYSGHRETFIRVIFKDGRVTIIEQTKV